MPSRRSASSAWSKAMRGFPSFSWAGSAMPGVSFSGPWRCDPSPGSQVQVEVATETGRVLSAKSAVVTLPLGVLQARRVAFSPQPMEILKAADSLVMGPAARVVYEFDSAFWKEFTSLKGVSFVFAPDATPPTWWTTSPKPGSTLTGWIAGRKAKRLEMDLAAGDGPGNALSPAGELAA